MNGLIRDWCNTSTVDFSSHSAASFSDQRGYWVSAEKLAFVCATVLMREDERCALLAH